MEQRLDISQWVIHFVHDRNPNNDPTQYFEEFTAVPSGFDHNGHPHYSEWDHWDEHYQWEPDASAFQVIWKIIRDGYLRAGWAHRNERPTIYGPHPAVCFTEMPLQAFIQYSVQRNDRGNISPYAIAIPRKELFLAGARPAIYGLSHDPVEASKGDPLFIPNVRCLADKCGLGLTEQYRYVATNLGPGRYSDWTHEREWRWPYNYEGDTEDVPGLPIWLQSSRCASFSKVVIIVPTAEERDRLLNLLKTNYDSGYIEGYPYNKTTLSATVVTAVEEWKEKAAQYWRIEDLPSIQLPNIRHVAVRSETSRLVKAAVSSARQAAADAVEKYKKTFPRTKDGHLADVFGFSWVTTENAQSEVTQALVRFNLASADPDHGYQLLPQVESTEGILGLEEIAARTMAEILSEQLGQPFYVHSYWD